MSKKIFLIILFLFISSLSYGTNYYVDKDGVNGTVGNDSNDGTSWATPWLTFSKGLATATAGDTVTVAAGTYLIGTAPESTAANPPITNTGTATAPILYTGQDLNNKPVITDRSDITGSFAWTQQGSPNTHVWKSNSVYSGTKTKYYFWQGTGMKMRLYTPVQIADCTAANVENSLNGIEGHRWNDTNGIIDFEYGTGCMDSSGYIYIRFGDAGARDTPASYPPANDNVHNVLMGNNKRLIVIGSNKNYITFNGLEFRGGGNINTVGQDPIVLGASDHITFNNSEFTSMGTGIYLRSGSGSTSTFHIIKNSKIHDIGGSCIEIGSSGGASAVATDNTIDNNEIYNCRGNGIYIRYQLSGDYQNIRNKITNNTVYDNLTGQINVDSKGNIVTDNVLKPIDYEVNANGTTEDGTLTGIPVLLSSTGGSDVSNMLIRNNIIFNINQTLSRYGANLVALHNETYSNYSSNYNLFETQDGLNAKLFSWRVCYPPENVNRTCPGSSYCTASPYTCETNDPSGLRNLAGWQTQTLRDIGVPQDMASILANTSLNNSGISQLFKDTTYPTYDFTPTAKAPIFGMGVCVNGKKKGILGECDIGPKVYDLIAPTGMMRVVSQSLMWGN